jgi:hypothetical protein
LDVLPDIASISPWLSPATFFAQQLPNATRINAVASSEDGRRCTTFESLNKIFDVLFAEPITNTPLG